jgi:cold shock CspA family protein
MDQPYANDGDSMQGVVKSYDPGTGQGVLLCDSDLAEYDLAATALEGSVFRMLRQGQRVIFDLDDVGRATHLRLGSEVDMSTPTGTSEGG